MEPELVKIDISFSPGDEKIIGYLFGSSEKAIIFSNMDSNRQNDWEPIIRKLLSQGYMLLTYKYPKHKEDQSDILSDVLAFIQNKGAQKIILVGASRGGVASIRVAMDQVKMEKIFGIIAISTPIVYKGITFYRSEELKQIKIPKLLINSKGDGNIADTLEMYKIFQDPKEMRIYSGDAHGTKIFRQHKNLLVNKLSNFIKNIFSNR